MNYGDGNRAGLREPSPRLHAARGTRDRRPAAFHRELPGYAVTPLVEAPALAAELGLDALWVKVESSRLALPSFKILGASWAVSRLLVDRFGTLPDPPTLDDLRVALATDDPITFVAATDGNHGRAVARMARLLGLRVPDPGAGGHRRRAHHGDRVGGRAPSR